MPWSRIVRGANMYFNAVRGNKIFAQNFPIYSIWTGTQGRDVV